MNVAAILKGPRLKVKRANSHIDSIIRDSVPLARELYEIVNEPEFSIAVLAQPDRFQLAYRPKEPVTDHFSPIIGDAVNNLREALDYWINAALKAVGQPRKAHFPFSEEWENLETSPNYSTIQKAFPDAAKFILKEIKPCRDTNLYLWASTSLCNFNKHNDFVPTISVVNIDNINARIGTNIIQNCGVGGDANRPIVMISSDSPITIDNDFSTSVEITFPDGAIFENRPVVPTITQMSKVVSETLNRDSPDGSSQSPTMVAQWASERDFGPELSRQAVVRS